MATSSAWRQRFIPSPGRIAVAVLHGTTATAILPDRDKPLGVYDDDKIIVTSEQPGPDGPRYDMFLYDKDDPQLAALRQQAGAVLDRTAPGK